MQHGRERSVRIPYMEAAEIYDPRQGWYPRTSRKRRLLKRLTHRVERRQGGAEIEREIAPNHRSPRKPGTRLSGEGRHLLVMSLRYPRFAAMVKADEGAYVAWLFEHANPDGLVT